MTKQKIIVVGAGLSGLTAAYELSKTGKYEIIVFESKPIVGGRVSTVLLDNIKIDLGGFMIFPWYKNFKALLNECSLLSEIIDIKNNGQLIKWDNETQFTTFTNSRFIKRVKLKMLIELLPAIITKRINFYEPDLDYFDGLTCGQFIEKYYGKDSSMYKTVNSISLGYTYPDINDIPLSTYAGFIPKLLLHDGFDKVKYLPGGTSRVVDALATKIVSNGGTVLTGHRVRKVSMNRIATSDEEYITDKIILSNGLEDGLLGQVIPSANNPKHTYYSNNFIVVFETENLPNINNETKWFVAYNQDRGPEDAPHVVSVGDLGAMMDYGQKNVLCVYVQLSHKSRQDYTQDDIQGVAMEFLKKNLSHIGKIKVIGKHHWQKTMPLIDPGILKEIRQSQGKAGIYYVGDYLGAPCMETAVYSGKKVANMIVSQALPDNH